MAKVRAIQAGGTYPFDPAKPWGWVFCEAARGAQVWREDLEEKAVLLLNRTTNPADAVEGGAFTSQHQPLPARRARVFEIVPASPPREFHAAVSSASVDGLTTNRRRELELCQPFQRGACSCWTRWPVPEEPAPSASVRSLPPPRVPSALRA
ncbi:unnamed protein product [Prorocentrum cordatum]|uniref:Alpha-galactosidase n=1 Tax=Prorocentrum cordatum TaxID=2364126 RepID=A0ABN9SKE1_9DINO|nr:unnamed protein product [Polarella glacialis]